MKKPFPYVFVILIVITICVSIVGGMIYRDKLVEENFVLGNVEVQVNEAQEKIYYIAQIPLTSTENGITLQDLSARDIAAFPEDVDYVKTMLNIEEVEVIAENVYEWQKRKNFDGVAIVPVDKVDYRLKTLEIEDMFFWNLDEESLAEYPLVFEHTIEIHEGEISDISNYNSDYLVSYVAGGEVIPARAVARKFRRTGDYTFPFHKVQKLFAEADIASVLLENSIAGSPEPCHGCTWFKGDEAFIEGLTYLGTDVISLAGNHMGDGGETAVERTIEVLDEAEIAHTGASRVNQDEASVPGIITIDDFTIAFLGYDDVAYYHWAGENHWGVATVSQRYANGTKKLLLEKIAKDVDRAKEEADYVIAIMSWGDREYVNWALEYQEEIGHALIDAGVDMIIGSHQHWVNELEFYNRKPIFYGLGNFVFDQTHTDPTRQGIFLKLMFYQKKLVSVTIIPHQSCGPQQSAVDSEECNHFQPQILEEDDPVYQIIMDRVWEHSEI